MGDRNAWGFFAAFSAPAWKERSLPMDTPPALLARKAESIERTAGVAPVRMTPRWRFPTREPTNARRSPGLRAAASRWPWLRLRCRCGPRRAASVSISLLILSGAGHEYPGCRKPLQHRGARTLLSGCLLGLSFAGINCKSHVISNYFSRY